MIDKSVNYGNESSICGKGEVDNINKDIRKDIIDIFIAKTTHFNPMNTPNL